MFTGYSGRGDLMLSIINAKGGTCTGRQQVQVKKPWYARPHMATFLSLRASWALLAPGDVPSQGMYQYYKLSIHEIKLLSNDMAYCFDRLLLTVLEGDAAIQHSKPTISFAGIREN